MRKFPDHPVIEKMERDGYLYDEEPEEFDYDRAYEERRDGDG
jgi:hypothetical protein